MKKFNKKFIFPLLIIVLLLASSFAFSQFFDIGRNEKGLIAHYKLDQASEKSFNYASFDGTSDYIKIANDEILSGLSSATISCWVNSSFIGVSKAIVSSRDGLNGMEIVGQADGEVSVWIGNGTTSKTITTTDFDMVADVWYHLIAFWDGTTIKAYKNGIISSVNDAITGTIGTTTDGINIGSDNGEAIFFNGQISDVRIYNRVLSADEISTLAKPANIGRKVVQGGLVGWWDMNGYTDKSENGNDGTNVGSTLGAWKLTADATGNGNDGIIYGASYAEDRFGNTNRVMNFDGNDYIDLGAPEILTELGVDNMTISAWIKTPIIESNKSIFSSRGESANEKIAFLVGSTNKISFNRYPPSSGGVSTNMSIPNDEWSNVIVVLRDDDDEVNFYINGAKELSSYIEEYSGDTPTKILIGAIDSGSVFSTYFDGNISDVRIYNYALSDSEIASLYEISKPADIFTGDLNKGLVGHWFLNGESEGIINNKVINGDFEDGTTDWNDWAATLESDTTVYYSGSKSIKVISDAGSPGYLFQNCSAFIVGKTYKFRAKVKSTAGTSTRFVAGGTDRIIQIPTTPGVWTEVVGYWTATAASTTFGIQTHLSGDTYWVDDFSVSEITTKDSTPYQNHGVINGATLTTGRNGESNGAYSFDGVDDFIEIKHNTLFEQNHAYTYSLWITPNNYTGIGSAYNLISKRSSFSNGFFIYINGINKELIFDFGGSSTRWNTSYIVPKDEYHLITIVAETSNLKLYIDGELNNSSLRYGNSSNLISGANLYIGKDRFTDNYRYNGKMSDVRIYNRALSADEINLLYNSTQPAVSTAGPLEKGLVLDAPLNSQSETQFSYAEFDGVNDYIETNNYNNFPTENNDRTISLWVNIPNFINDYMGLFQYGTKSTDLGFNVYSSLGSNKISVGKHGGDKSSKFILNLNKWEHVVVILKKTNEIYFYLNNEKDGPYILDGINTLVNIATFGVCGSSWKTPNFNGQMSDVRLYNRALTEDEITILSKGENINKDVVQSGLVGWWTMNDVDDKSGNGNDGTNNGATLVKSETVGSVTGNIKGQVYGAKVTGEYMEFDGVDDYVEIEDNDELKFGTTNFSINMWIYPETYRPYVLTKGSGYSGHGGVAKSYSIEGSSAEDKYKISFYLRDGVNKYTNSWYSSIYALEYNKWHLVTMTVDRNNYAKLYLNGNFISQVDITSMGDISNSYPIRFGAERGDSISYWDGNLLGVKIYNRVLDADEIQTLYETTKPKVTEADINRGLVLDMPLDEEYVNGTDLVSGWDLTSGWGYNSYTTIIDNNSFSTITAAAGPYKNIGLTVGKKYQIIAEGNTTGQFNLRNSQGSGSDEYLISNDFGTYEFTAQNSYIYLRNPIAGTTNITKLEVREVQTTDKTSNKNDGTVYGATSDNEGMSFDGVNDYIRKLNPNNLPINNNSVTMSAWVNLNSLSGLRSIVEIGSSNTNNLGIRSSDGIWAVKVTSDFPSLYIYVGGSPIINKWFFVSLTYDNNILKFYENGILIYQETLAINLNHGGNNLFNIGTNFSLEAKRMINAKISDVRIYNRALNQDEIEYLYNKGR